MWRGELSRPAHGEKHAVRAAASTALGYHPDPAGDALTQTEWVKKGDPTQTSRKVLEYQGREIPSMQLCNRLKKHPDGRETQVSRRHATKKEHSRISGVIGLVEECAVSLGDTGRPASSARMENTKEMETNKKPRHINMRYRGYLES